MESLDSLRNQVARKQRSASAKVNRLTKAGINVPASGIDPRRDVSRVKKYNRRQLTSYLGELNRFTERTNRWTAGPGGAAVRPGASVIERALPRLFEQTRRRYNAESERRFETVAPIMTYKGVTVRERDTEVTSRRSRARGRSSIRPMDTFERDAKSYGNNKRAMRRDLEKMRARLDGNYYKGALDKQRGYALQMAEEIGDPVFAQQLRDLSDDQFDALWNFTPYATEISFWYEAQKLRHQGKALDLMQTELERGAIDNARTGMKWAQLIPRDRSRVKAKRGRK